MARVRYKIPSQAASGADTFSDNLVGRQVTDGSSQFTNANFAIDRTIPERDVKEFTNLSFSDFVTLNTLSDNQQTSKKEKIKFNSNKDDAGKSLFGSLMLRLGVSIDNIINKYPAAFLIDSESKRKSSQYTLQNIVYNSTTNLTEFEIELFTIYNPLNIIFINSKDNTSPTIKDFYSSFKNYVLIYEGIAYDIVSYSEPNLKNILKIKIKGKPFTDENLTVSVLIRPNDSIVEEFYNDLDELESSLLNRETNPIHNATFKVPRETYDGSSTTIIGIDVNWPVSKDGWNIQTVGIEYSEYIEQLKSLSDEIDNYKSNLIVRFLTAPQLFEFDTDDKYAESIFQLYGQNFDKVKKYIDNIALMRHVSYDSINNLPDLLLKNLSENLGLKTFNLFDENSLNNVLYTRENTTYEGITVGKNLIESEYEFYRRILINLSFLYKSKGSRSTLNFLLKFIGAPEQMIQINEYVYDVISTPNRETLEDDIYDLVNQLNEKTIITGVTQSSTGVTYTTGLTANITITRNDYPIGIDGLPKKIINDINFFQKGAGWYEPTLEHRSSLTIDYENSVLTGRTKFTKTKNKPFTYGEEYFNKFRNLENLDYGFDLSSRIDNEKIINSKLILNRKNLDVFLSPSQTVDYDIWRKSRDFEQNFGTMTPQTGVTFSEFLGLLLSKNIQNSNTVKYDYEYYDLKEIYNKYVSNNSFTSYNFISVHEFIEKISPNWTKIIEQFIPATTLWIGGNLIENTKFGRSKYKYKKPCQIFEMINNRYPDFKDTIDTYPLATYFKFYPLFKIDDVIYSGNTYNANVSAPVNYTTLNTLWDNTLSSFITHINTTSGYTMNNVGKDNEYGATINYSGITGSTIILPLLSYSTFIDEDGVDKINFKSYKYDYNKCTVMKSFHFQVLIEHNG